MQDVLTKVQEDLVKIRQQKTEILEQERNAENRLLPFKRFFHQFYTQFFPYTETEIVSTTYLPKIDGYDYRAKSATEKNMAILGYFYALLRFSLESPSFIPRFMIIDTLRQDNLARESYSKVLWQFQQLEEIYGKAFQLFVVVNENFEFLPHAKISLTPSSRLLDV